MKKTIKGLITSSIFLVFGATTVFAGTVSGGGNVNLQLTGTDSKSTRGWETFVKGDTVKTTEKCTITIQPKTGYHKVTSLLQIRKHGTFVNSVVDTEFFFNNEKYDNTRDKARKLTWNIMYYYHPSSSGEYDYRATTTGVTDRYYTEYTGSYRY